LALYAPDRIAMFTRYILHSVALNEKLKIGEMFNLYVRSFSNVVMAQNPEQFTSQIDHQTLAVYGGLSKSINFESLGCVVGSMVGGPGGAGGGAGMAELKIQFGQERWDLLKSMEYQNITNRQEFIQKAKALGKDPSKFPKVGECDGCGAHTFLGPCKWCIVCEVKDDLGIRGSLSDGEDGGNHRDELARAESIGRQYRSDKIDLDIFVNSLMTPQVLEAA
jgi:hypothetical protein